MRFTLEGIQYQAEYCLLNVNKIMVGQVAHRRLLEAVSSRLIKPRSLWASNSF